MDGSLSLRLSAYDSRAPINMGGIRLLNKWLAIIVITIIAAVVIYHLKTNRKVTNRGNRAQRQIQRKKNSSSSAVDYVINLEKGANGLVI
jgi:hypothetical protein